MPRDRRPPRIPTTAANDVRPPPPIGRAGIFVWLGVLSLGLGCVSVLDKAKSAHAQGNWDEADTLYEKAAGKPDFEADARRGRADLWAERGRNVSKTDPKAAQAHYRRALALVPAHNAALTGLVRVLRRQDRLDDASRAVQDAEATGSCTVCKRLRAVIALERADIAFAAGEYERALGLYKRAAAQREQPGIAVAIAATQLHAGASAEALEALIEAAPLLVQADDSTIDRFVATRAALLSGALKENALARADKIAAVQRPKESPARHTERSLQIAHAVYEGGDKAGAIARYEPLLAIEGDAAMPPGQRTLVANRIVGVYADRGTRHLHAGRAAEARTEFERAIALKPDDWLLKLQRILALSATAEASALLTSLDQLPANTAGLAHTKAIVLALRVREQLDQGEVSAAEQTLRRAQNAHPDLPEVHLAAAQVLAQTPSDELTPREQRALRSSKSLVPYPGEVFRYAEALSEVAWVRTELAERNPEYPFTAPSLVVATDALQQEIGRIYPYEVQFQPEPEPVLLLENRSRGFLEIKVRGRAGYKDEFGIPPGDTREVVAPDSGMLHLQVGRARRVFYAEGYAKVTIGLP